VFFDVKDANGNARSCACRIAVPHDMSGSTAVEDGCAYCEGTGCNGCPGHGPTCTF